jgi:phosphate transport system permease protein
MSDRIGFSLAPTRQLRRRKAVNRLMEALMLTAALAAVAVLLLVVAAVVVRGHGALTKDFFTKGPTTNFLDSSGGGILNSIVGTIVIVSCATVFSLPLGILIAIYSSEFAQPRVRRFLSFVLDILNGVPSIVIAIFIFGLLVLGHTQSALAAGVALAIIMLPLIARSAQEVLALVPESLREASFALGVSRWRTVLGVILPTSFGGILTGATLAVARAAGETAPLLFTCSLTTTQTSWDPRQALQSIPLTIFQDLEQPDPALHTQAWGAALVLMGFVLVVSVLSKSLLARSRRKLTR